MDVALNRKRSRLALEEDDDDDEHRSQAPLPSPALADTLKRSRTESELDSLDMVAPAHAWSVDVAAILSSPTFDGAPGRAAHNNGDRFAADASIIVFCVQGNLQLHYDLLCAALPELYTLSPSLQALVLCCDPASHVPSASTPSSLPLIQAVAPEYNHFVKLGLSHPLGGGHLPLDALVVVDPRARRRLVLPFGWGAGRH
ncbi:hypothetical protein BDV96DRAFT_469122, partial [Lophiotrema nucula]